MEAGRWQCLVAGDMGLDKNSSPLAFQPHVDVTWLMRSLWHCGYGGVTICSRIIFVESDRKPQITGFKPECLSHSFFIPLSVL